MFSVTEFQMMKFSNTIKPLFVGRRLWIVKVTPQYSGEFPPCTLVQPKDIMARKGEILFMSSEASVSTHLDFYSDLLLTLCEAKTKDTHAVIPKFEKRRDSVRIRQ